MRAPKCGLRRVGLCVSTALCGAEVALIRRIWNTSECCATDGSYYLLDGYGIVTTLRRSRSGVAVTDISCGRLASGCPAIEEAMLTANYTSSKGEERR